MKLQKNIAVTPAGIKARGYSIESMNDYGVAIQVSKRSEIGDFKFDVCQNDRAVGLRRKIKLIYSVTMRRYAPMGT